MKYSLEDRLRIIKLFYKSRENARETQRRFFESFQRRISLDTILRIKTLFEETKTLKDRRRNIRRQNRRDQAILRYFTTNPMSSIPQALREIRYGAGLRRVSYGTVQRTLKKFGFKPYCILPVQFLTQEQKELRFRFVATMLIREQDEDNNLYNKILWTDEASFTTSGVYNRKNTNYWSAANPHKYEMIKFQGRSSINVWCGMLANQIIGPLFYRGSLTGQRYLRFLQNEIEDLLEELPLQIYNHIIWQHDGAPPHAVRDVVEYLNGRYNEWIGRNGTLHWPPNSPDITPMDTFLWGHLKNVVYQRPNRNIEELQQKIINEIDRLNQYPNIIRESLDRLKRGQRSCFENNGGHIEHLYY